MIKIGLTGGIGSGKSIIADLFQVLGVPVYIADTESKQLTNTSPQIRNELTVLYGEDLYLDSGIDKKRLASIIFNDPEQLKLVNRIIHPVVNRHFLEWAASRKTSLCVIETAILFESGFDRSVDFSLMVYAPLELRIERTLKRDKASREDIIRRINNQLPDEEKKERADYVIYNDGKSALIPQLAHLIRLFFPE
ncbi:dephospho-CoA kinase [Parabacteroides sp. PF5-5]|uniref:dephospho-CoA kinase n=1 Tax=unclassified Parabacteroides TaxID=2649774 RepID=UPI00247599C7|nr:MULTISPECIES: dephospho-CoA kinase [unclassified Parabacteroides]MDH6306649.1 dephospho-CoA kinase [Parabacteroides sp. PH5-39]MDH6317616.1 dephospho-CoA kinase [Parabacteroides sp. PF5-13]MDH6321360.1 dephospho-CoA kinase [Parabacteroides sp. PH5-13]MDH6325075.1 dephospho-CoA kinase [Parabacteroides sp. PH5-8]MDH6328784.1 dephospho-CoA kinase [Parabacteroides sp. PH5-41]